MGISFERYDKGYRVVSVALDENTKNDLLTDELDFLYITEKRIELYPDGCLLEARLNVIEYFRKCRNYDVFEIYPDGKINVCYSDESTDNYFFVTGKCNSNCIMCPSPEFARKHSDNADIDNLILIAKHIPEDAAHLTLTGGEPFMVGDRIFDFFEFLKCKFERTDFLVLTNARIFAVDKYAKRLRETIPNSLIVGIPLHGSNAEIHDAITQTKNSFEQTMIGIKRLLALKIRIELRIVVNKLNVTDLENIALLIAEEIPSIEYVSIMAMEMTGNAYVNREIVWIPYKESFAEVGNAVDVLLENGIDVKLYNFPLCTVKHKYWTLCERSISPNKIRYAKICDECKVKNVCGGIFAGTFNLERGELEAQL